MARANAREAATEAAVVAIVAKAVSVAAAAATVSYLVPRNEVTDRMLCTKAACLFANTIWCHGTWDQTCSKSQGPLAAYVSLALVDAPSSKDSREWSVTLPTSLASAKTPLGKRGRI